MLRPCIERHTVDRAGEVFGHLVDLECGHRIRLDTGHFGDFGLEPFGPALGARFLRPAVVGAAVAILIEGDIFARRVQIGREHARVPAAARAVFGHGHAGRDLEEFERFGGVAVLVARAVVIAHVGSQHGFEIGGVVVGGER